MKIHNNVDFFLPPDLVDGSYSITWRRVGGMMPSMVTVNNGILIFPETRSEYSGQYFCIISTEYGVFQEVVTLIVLGESEISFDL